MRIALLLTLAFILFGSMMDRPAIDVMVEICDNAIDDDSDGLIDLNDPDCDCPVLEPVSLIPNPSFEDAECCPQSRSNLECAETWIQASEATTDYLHTCGWMGWQGLEPPLPFPDGDACIGFRNGRFSENEPEQNNPNWKEYTGACLTEPLRAGTTYRLEFYIGFTHARNSPALTVALFGSTDCKNLPFGDNDEFHGCPLNGPGWVQLETEYASGANNWQKKVFEVTPQQDMYSIAIGPDCRERTSGPNPYYFLDNLILADIREFEFVISGENDPCSDEFSLSLPARDSLDFQWYRDGVALLEETAPKLSQFVEDGKYQVQIKGRNICKVTKSYFFSRAIFRETIQVPLCPQSSHLFNQHELFVEGIYFDTLKTAQGCDSIIKLDLQDAPAPIIDLPVQIFDGETLMVGSQQFTSPTSEQVFLTSHDGCDSTVNLELSFYDLYIPNAFSPNGDGLNDVFEIKGGADLVAITYVAIVDRWGGELFHSNPNSDGKVSWDGRSHGEPVMPGSYIYVVDVLMSDQVSRRLTGVVELIK